MTLISPSTRTERTTVALTRGRDGRPRLRATGGLFRALPLESTAVSLTAALVPDRALLLAGDAVAIDVTVEPGLGLHLRETSGTVAYDMRGGRGSWSLTADVQAEAHLVLDTLPWVSAAGSRVIRTTSIALDAGASLLAREVLVLGRAGETWSGELDSRTEVRWCGTPVLIEELDGANLAPYRVIDSVLALGSITEAPAGPAPMVLEDGGRLWRMLADSAHTATTALDGVWDALVVSQALAVSASLGVGTTKR